MNKIRPPDDGIVDDIAIELALTGKRPDVAIRLTDAELLEAFRVGLRGGLGVQQIGARVRVSGVRATELAAVVRRERIRLVSSAAVDRTPPMFSGQQAA